MSCGMSNTDVYISKLESVKYTKFVEWLSWYNYKGRASNSTIISQKLGYLQ